jgi:hypothetical protein
MAPEVSRHAAPDVPITRHPQLGLLIRASQKLSHEHYRTLSTPPQVLNVLESGRRAGPVWVGADDRRKILRVVDDHTAEVYDLGPAPRDSQGPVMRAATKLG